MHVDLHVKISLILDGFFKNIQIENFKKIRHVGAERTDRSDEANSRFSQFCERV